MVSRIAGGVLLFVAVLGLVWTFATAENVWTFCYYIPLDLKSSFYLALETLVVGQKTFQ
jgi:hypothetical protein